MSLQVFTNSQPLNHKVSSQHYENVNEELLAEDQEAEPSAVHTLTEQVQQLEKEKEFLREQHRLMLVGLQRELEVVQHRNRDLLDLVFLGVQHDNKLLVQTKLERLERECYSLKNQLDDKQKENLTLQKLIREQEEQIHELQREKQNWRTTQLRRVQVSPIPTPVNLGENLSVVGHKVQPTSRKRASVPSASLRLPPVISTNVVVPVIQVKENPLYGCFPVLQPTSKLPPIPKTEPSLPSPD